MTTRPRTPDLADHSTPALHSSQTSPFKSTLAGSRQFNATVDTADETKDAVSDEMQGLWIGFLKPTDFFEAFLDINGKILEDGADKIRSVNFDDIPTKPAAEPDMYPSFVSV